MSPIGTSTWSPGENCFPLTGSTGDFRRREIWISSPKDFDRIKVPHFLLGILQVLQCQTSTSNVHQKHQRKFANRNILKGQEEESRVHLTLGTRAQCLEHTTVLQYLATGSLTHPGCWGKQIRLILLKHKHTDQHTKSRQALPCFKPVVTFQSMPTTNGPCGDWHGQHPVENPSVPSFQISGKCSPWMPCTKHGLSRSLWAEFMSPCWTQPCLKTTYLIHPHSNHPAVKVSLITVLS